MVKSQKDSGSYESSVIIKVDCHYITVHEIYINYYIFPFFPLSTVANDIIIKEYVISTE